MLCTSAFEESPLFDPALVDTGGIVQKPVEGKVRVSPTPVGPQWHACLVAALPVRIAETT